MYNSSDAYFKLVDENTEYNNMCINRKQLSFIRIYLTTIVNLKSKINVQSILDFSE